LIHLPIQNMKKLKFIFKIYYLINHIFLSRDFPQPHSIGAGVYATT
jgi:hypothetical protein